jgi:hypothetical protein
MNAVIKDLTDSPLKLGTVVASLAALGYIVVKTMETRGIRIVFTLDQVLQMKHIDSTSLTTSGEGE